jgi:hypothetical protein
MYCVLCPVSCLTAASTADTAGLLTRAVPAPVGHTAWCPKHSQVCAHSTPTVSLRLHAGAAPTLHAALGSAPRRPKLLLVDDLPHTHDSDARERLCRCMTSWFVADCHACVRCCLEPDICCYVVVVGVVVGLCWRLLYCSNATAARSVQPPCCYHWTCRLSCPRA